MKDWKPVKLKGKVIGNVRKNGPNDWESWSYLHEQKSGGLMGYDGIESEQEAIKDVLELHEEWS